MGDPARASEERYATIVTALQSNAGVSFGSPKGQGFGSSALKVHGKIFAMISAKGEFVLKLPRQRVDALIASGAGVRFDPGHGHRMKEWVAIAAPFEDDYLPLAREALAFVASKPQ